MTLSSLFSAYVVHIFEFGTIEFCFFYVRILEDVFKVEIQFIHVMCILWVFSCVLWIIRLQQSLG